jgi:Zn-finger nucleic acid-binding protein
VEDAVIDFCSRCRGSWFDLHELQSVYEQRESAAALLLPALPHLKRDPLLCGNCGKQGSRLDTTCRSCKSPFLFLCPSCAKPLEIKIRGGVGIDSCQQCKGVWLDGGELTVLFESYSKAIQSRNTSGDAVAGAAAAADLALDMFIWAPDLYIAATAQVLTHLPELASKGLEIAGDLPEIAVGAADGLIKAAGSASDVAATAISGSIEVAGNIAEAATDTAASFMQAILSLITDIFD